jgi:hypothetical protein
LFHRGLGAVDRHPIVVVAAVAAVARLAAVVLLGPLRHGVVVPDEKQYIDLAAAVATGRGAESWRPGYGQQLFDSTSAFMRPLTLLTELFGPHQMSGQVLAAAFGVLTAVLTTVLALRVTGRRWACAAGLIVALLPSQVFWSSIVLRESMVWTCLVALALAVALAATAQSRRKLVLPVALAAAGLWGLGDLRGQTAVVAGVALVGASLLAGRRHRVLVPVGATLIAIVMPILAGLGIAGLGLVETSVPRLATLRTALSLGADSAFVERRQLPPEPSPAAGATPGAPGVGPSAPVVVGPSGDRYAVDNGADATLSALPRGLVAVTVRPLPWEAAPSVAVKLAKMENVLWSLGYVLALIGVVDRWRNRDMLAFPVLATGLVVGVAAVTQGNLGTAFRHRGQVLWAVALLAVLGLESLVQRLSSRAAAGSETVDVRA